MSISLYCCSAESHQESRLARTPALPLTRQPTMTAAGRFAGKWSGCPTCGLSPYCPALRSKALSGRRGGGLAGLNRPAGPAHHPRRAGALCGRLARCRRRPHQHFHPAATCMAGHDRQEWSEHLALMPSCPALSTQGRAVPAQHRRRVRLTLHRPGSARSPANAGSDQIRCRTTDLATWVVKSMTGGSSHPAMTRL